MFVQIGVKTHLFIDSPIINRKGRSMNINLHRSYHQLAIRGKITDSLRLPQKTAPLLDIVQQYWPLNRFDFYVTLDLALEELKSELREEVKKVRAGHRNRCQQTTTAKLIGMLKDWLRLIKKIEFYHIDTSMKSIFYDEEGLLALYECGNIHSIYLLSQIEKYRVKNVEEDSLTLADLRKDELEIIFRDVCLKISKHLLSQLKNEMYYPSKELVIKLLKFYGFHYDFTLTFQENYQIALAEKRVVASQESRESVIIFFTFKMICCFQNLPDVCYYVSYLKNILLDRSSGVLTAEYETWLLLYETCLKLFSRYENLRVQQCIEVDQILSSSFTDGQFQSFLLKNASSSNVSLSSINFYIKNCKKEQKDELKPSILVKIDRLIESNFWKYIEDIFEYIENELQGNEKEDYLSRIKTKISYILYEDVSSQKLYEVEYGLTFILENLVKYIREFEEIISAEGLKEITKIIKEKPSREKVIVAFRLFNQFINILYSQTSYESMDLPEAKELLYVVKLFQDSDYVCSKSVYKFIYYQLSSEESDEDTWDSFFGLLAEVYFCGGYDENSDLELIHSHESYRECLATKILQTFQTLICSQIIERKELAKCLEGSSPLRNSYFIIRGFKDNLLFQSIQNICLIFNSPLSMQTLEFGLNYCTPFGFLAPWQAEESEVTLLSLICEEMPIETLKFIYKEICEEEKFDTDVLETIPAQFWSGYWGSDRHECAAIFGEQSITLQKLQALQKLRRFQFILNLSCCVFDKLNQNSQKNIKQIKIIYENGAAKIIDLSNKLKKTFLQALNVSLLKKIEGLSEQEINNLQLIDEENNSFMITNYINRNNFLYIAKEFNLIGKVNESQKLIEVEEALLPTLKQLKFSPKDKSQELFYKQVEFCLNIEASYLKKLVEKEEKVFSYEIEVSKEWAKHLSTNAASLIALIKKQKSCKEREGMTVLGQRVNDHIKCLLSKILLPEVLVFLLTGECKLILSKHLFSLMKVVIELIYAIDTDYEQHFIILIEKIEQIFRDNKNKQIQSQYILSLLELFFQLIFNKIRIRSYHLYRIIKYYQKITSENMEQFNAIIAQHIRILFEEFITNYKNINEVQHLCSSKKSLNPIYAKFAKQEHNLNFIETACTLSMFINLFCRLNYTSLTLGVEKIFSEEQAKAIYIDYLSSLTRKIVTEDAEISPRDLEILKIDVYGNLNIITQGHLSERLMNKLISLAKNLLRVKIDMKGVNKLPIKILAEKIASEQLEINLQEFEDECKAISLGAISVHKKLAVYVTSNLHLCNIYYITGRNFEKYIDLNHTILNRNRQELSQQVGKVARLGLTALNIEIGQEIQVSLEALMRKLEKYYEISLRESEYAEKLYSIFKILCISCLNNPEILPLLLNQKLTVNKTLISFYQFAFLTLKHCLPLFCQFYTTVIKTNSGFIKISQEEVISTNLELQLTIKKKLLSLFREEISKKQSTYIYLTRAINYVQQYSEGNRFRFYKFVKNTNEVYENVLREFEKEFNNDLIRISEEYIKKGYTSFSCFEIYEMLEVSMERTYVHSSTLDLKKLMNEELLKKTFYCEKEHPESNKQNLCETERKSRENETARSKSLDTTQYKPLLQQIMQSSSKILPQTTKGKKSKDAKLLRFNYLQEDLINTNDSKFIVAEWNSNLSGKSQSEMNKIMIEKFMLFNEEIENRQFLKDAIVFPSKSGLELISGGDARLTKGSDQINEDDQPQEFPEKIQENSNELIESFDNIRESQEILNFSEKIIEESEPVYEFIETDQCHQGQSDSIIYSEIEIENYEDGSMKLFGDEDVSQPQENEEINEEVSKDDIIELIEDYTLNPEAIKQIVFKIKYVPTRELQKLHSQQSGEIAYVLEAELRNRGINFPPEANSYEFFFMDESKIYERLKNNKRMQDKDRQILIPQFSSLFLREWFKIIFKAANEERMGGFSKRVSNFCRRMLLELKNIDLLIGETLQVIDMDNNQFQLKYQDSVNFSKKFTPEYYKQILVDQIFGMMVEYRIALPVIFYGFWNRQTGSIVPRNVQAPKNESIIEILLSVLIKSNEKESTFLKNLLEYMQTLNKATKYQYPYFEIQDSITLSKKIIEELSEKMHLAGETFSDNEKYFKIFRTMFFLQVKSYQEFLKLELAKITEIVKKSYLKQDNVLQIFRKNYSSEEGLEIERKAEIYWQLRKSKNTDEFNSQLIFCRKMFTDMASIVLEKLKENCFTLYYKGEELTMKEELLYLRRKMNEIRHFSQRYELEQQFKEKERRYSFWKRNLINMIIVEEIVPAIEEISSDFLEQIKQTTELLSELYANFNEIIKTTPIIFRQSAEYYKLMLAYELLKKQEEQTFHSMSTLKTIPSIQSTRQMDGGRRRSSLINRHSIFQINCIDTSTIVKKSAIMLTLDCLAMQTTNPLFGMHAKNADMQTKLKYLKQQNKLGEKVIQVSRENMWMSTAPHLDDSFGNYDIKIKIAGQIGIDYGGVTREWLNVIVKQILDPRLGLFELNVNQLAFQPSKFSYLVPNHLDMFHKFGILVGKAMKQNWLLELNFTKSFLKHMLGALLYVEDLEDIEPDTAKGLLWILKNYVDEDLGLTFTYEESILENKRTVELVPGGTQVYVTEMNKKQYVKKLAYTKMTESIREQSLAFISGVEKVISIQMLKLFNYRQIGKYFAGISIISIPEMNTHAKYEGYSQDNENIVWFWQIMQNWTEQDKAEFLFFLTGSYRVPYSGFKDNPITINKMSGCKDYLPVAHTCFSIIDLPEYSSKEKMERMLTRAVKEGKGFTVS